MTRLFLILTVCFALASIEVFGCGAPGEPSNCGNEAVEVSDRTERMANEFDRELRQGRLRERTNMALDAMIRFAAFKLRAKGNKIQAQKLIDEWEGRWNGYIMRVGRDLGDHRPLSKWIAEKYAVIEFLLGVEICHALRLDDIKIINFGIPVVFSCVDDVDEAEYALHFVPFSGTVIFWTAFISCVGGTWGTGFLFCSPIAMGCEFVTERWLAPKLNPTVWNWSCQ